MTFLFRKHKGTSETKMCFSGDQNFSLRMMKLTDGNDSRRDHNG
eukprot:CAMPEP_0171544566 /NCGR_PEP_ID=MMETSP0960-20121227/3576_1 /TAXON_ID=87120 /ORGANISM="Aurantiochytrium limacinum, Strain ATCCMYA-1381" /LENGTH=43 /DNA_ID= /DNA_START= /DNA_END= /DNA_ORIENTATION=